LTQQVEKRPRHYAVDILIIDSKAERVEYLNEKVPPHFQDWVKLYVRMWWPRRGEIRGNKDAGN
jgi:hypothetical protein